VRHALLIQRYVPEYRVPLFTALSHDLAGRGIRLLVAHGSPTGAQAARGDLTGGQSWAYPVRHWTATLPGGLSPTWARLDGLVREADVVVTELASTALNTWQLVLLHPHKTLLWGHGKSYVSKPNAIDSRLELFMSRRAAQVLTYTESGRADLISRGIDASHITAVGNSTDTTSLRRLQRETAGEAAAWRATVGSPGPVALFVGGLDKDKRIALLLAAGRSASLLDPKFRLVVAGRGTESKLVDELQDETWLVRLDRVTPRDLAGLSHVCSAVWMPGRVGLVAVDALALGLPVLTTGFAFHAPEMDYLEEGRTKHTLSDIPERFAQEALALMHSPQAERSSREVPSVEAVASRMANAVESVVSRPRP
jgi:glycosyltransferase involved in cell wall biosynthesis